jgi:DNA invertase Pin-like site-specific DNA recombinase
VRYVIYTRVSTEDQGKSGLGLEAQERDIELFLANFSEVPFEVLGRFCDVLSGADADRPQLAAAIKMARDSGAELLVAKLDRLSRKVSQVSAFMDDKRLKLRVAQMPHADKFQLHIYAALAEQEREFISARTKAALQAAKARGVKLGGAHDTEGKRHAALQAKAGAEAARAMVVIGPMKRDGASLRAIAAALDAAGIPTSRGGRWSGVQVSRALVRVQS